MPCISSNDHRIFTCKIYSLHDNKQPCVKKVPVMFCIQNILREFLYDKFSYAKVSFLMILNALCKLWNSCSSTESGHQTGILILWNNSSCREYFISTCLKISNSEVHSLVRILSYLLHGCAFQDLIADLFVNKNSALLVCHVSVWEYFECKMRPWFFKFGNCPFHFSTE